ncbi:MAG: hypothetical protein ACYTG7_17380, partial [Planctomycetota bacterium]
MKTLISLLVILCCGFVFALENKQEQPVDEYRAVITACCEAPGQDQPGPESRAGSGNLLFSMNGPDNAACVRSIDDVTGDGKDEIIVGFDVSQVDNLYCLDGSSSGTATVVWKLMTDDGVSGGGFWGDNCIKPSSDVDGNSYANFLCGTAWGGRTAYCKDGLDGATVWKLDTYTLTNSGWIYSLCECGDVNGDD